MNVLVDSNVLLSYLAYPERPTAPVRIVGRLLTGIDLFILPPYVVNEVREKARSKTYFAAWVLESDVARFLDSIAPLATPSPSLPSPIPRWTRDAKDDVLVAIAPAARVDYLISGDKDLLVLGDTLAPLKVRSPQAFLDEVEGESRPGVD